MMAPGYPLLPPPGNVLCNQDTERVRPNTCYQLCVWGCASVAISGEFGIFLISLGNVCIFRNLHLAHVGEAHM